MAAVIFNYANWAARYGELASWVTAPQAQAFFYEACLYLDNTDTSPVTDDSVGGQRALYLGMLTSHIAALNAPLNGQPSSPLVGRINNASEGSVSVQTENLYPPGTVQWYQQTKYGAAFWAATSRFRSMLYVPGHPRREDPFASFFRRLH